MNSFSETEPNRLMQRAHEKAVNGALWLFVVHDTNLKAVGRVVRGYVPAQHWFEDLTTQARGKGCEKALPPRAPPAGNNCHAPLSVEDAGN
jgi:hypothetical protein